MSGNFLGHENTEVPNFSSESLDPLFRNHFLFGDKFELRLTVCQNAKKFIRRKKVTHENDDNGPDIFQSNAKNHHFKKS